jgi:uncharacterized protein (DUF1697 family)
VPRQVALLRGINLGAKRRVSMPELRELLAAQGHGDVRTHLQSGNVVLTSRAAPARLERRLEREIAAGLGIETRVLVRTRDELADVVQRDPLGEVASDPKRYTVSFLSEAPDQKVVRELADEDLAPERFVISGREVYAWQPSGTQRSRVSQLLSERRLGVEGTVRNWNTVTKLLALADE